MGASHRSFGSTWPRGRDRAAVAVACRLPAPPTAGADDPAGPARAILRAQLARLPWAADIVYEYSGGSGGYPPRLVVLFPPGSDRAPAEALAAALRAEPSVSDVVVLTPAAGDALPPLPPAI